MRSLKNKVRAALTAVLAAAMCVTVIVPAGATAFAAQPDGDATYTVTLADCENGKLSFPDSGKAKKEFAEGDEVTVDVTPDAGYAFTKITLSLTETGETAAEDEEPEAVSYTFTMPNADITVGAEFEETEEAEPSDTFTVEESETDPYMELQISEGIDESITGPVEGFEIANALEVKNTMFFADELEEGDTLDSVMGGIEKGDMDALNKWIAQVPAYFAVYNVNDDSDYLVAFANTMDNVAGASVRDWCFAVNNNNGEVLDECIYDEDTGIAYIPKECYEDGDGSWVFNGVQLQLMQAMKGDIEDMDAETESSVVEKDEATVYDSIEAIFEMETTVQAEPGLDEGNLVVTVNGIPLDEEHFDYDPDTGEVTVPYSSAAARYVSVSADNGTLLSRLADKADSLFTITAYALDSWSDMENVLTDEPLESWVKAGTALYGEMTMQYGAEDNHWGNTNAVYGLGDSGAITNSKLLTLYNYIYKGGTYLSENGYKNLVEETNYRLFLFEFSKGADLTYRSSLKNNRYNGDDEPKGETCEFISDLPNLVAECAHVSTDIGGDKSSLHPSAYEEFTADTMIRFLRVDRSSGYAVFGLASEKVNTQAGTGIFKMTITPTAGCLTLEKSSDHADWLGYDAYSLKDAEYTVYTDKDCTAVAKDTDGEKAVLTTAEDGTSDTIELETGTYYVKETKASAGHDLDETVYEAEITPDNTEDVPCIIKSTEAATPVCLTLKKSSGNTSITDGNACYSLADAVYTVYTDSSCKTVLKQPDGSDAVLTTDSQGNTNTVEISAGTWYVKETKASKGFLLCDETNPCENSDSGVHKVTATFSNTEDNPAVVKCTETPGNDPAGITLYKIDSKTGESVTLGAASLEGAEFTVRYYDGYYANGSDENDTSGLPEEATREWVIQTIEYDGMYQAELNDTCKVSGDDLYYTKSGLVTLPLGTYTIQETKAPDGYLLEGQEANSKNWVSEHTYVAPVHVGEVTLTANTVNALSVGNESDVEESVKRFDITLEKHDGDTQASMGSIEFEITSLTTGESHCFWTDDHGNYTSSADVNPHSYDTDNATDQHSGLWFYGSADESEGAPVDDDLGALPYDSYRIDEIEGENNEGYEMYHDTFTVGAGGNDYSGEVIDLGLINNYPPDDDTPEPYIHSLAWAGDTGTQLCYAGDEWVTLYDDVWYYNLEPGATYYLYGIAYDVDTGEPETDHYGNVISAVTEFVADESGDGMEVQEFYFDVEDLSGHRAVFYETVYQADENGEYTIEVDGEEIAVTLIAAEDPEDYPNETIYFPQVGTTLIDAESGTHYSVADGVVTLVDTVAVSEVPEGTECEVSGTLMSKDTGEAVLDADGNPVTAGTTFTSTGLEEQIVEIEFTFDASELGESGVVAFEDLYMITDTDYSVGNEDVPDEGEETEDEGRRGVLVGRHADLDDEGQTVEFPTVHTTATDSKTGTHTSDAAEDTVIIDRVDYSGLTVGEEYTITGTLMDQSTGKELIDSSGNTVTSEVTFTAESEDGYIDMEFEVDTSLLAGTTIVVFEDLYKDGVQVATHSDITDVAQSVNVPEIGTTASDAEDGDKEVAAGEVTVNDEVEYSGLEPGRTYTMTGTLMDKETGEAVVIDGEAVTGEVRFTPTESSGTVTVPIKANTASVAGHDLVVFEKCYELNDEGIYVEVASHEDLKDKGQTVTVAQLPAADTPAEATGGPGITKTGEGHMGLILGIVGCAAAAAVILIIVFAVRRRRRM